MNGNMVRTIGLGLVVGLLAVTRAWGQELPQPLTRQAGQKPHPATITHEHFLKAVEESRKTFDRVYCEGRYEYQVDPDAELQKGTLRCWHYFRQGQGSYPDRRFLRYEYEMEGGRKGVWLFGEDYEYVLHGKVMTKTRRRAGGVLDPGGPSTPPPLVLLIPPPGGFGQTTYHAMLDNPYVKRSHQRKGDVLELVHDVVPPAAPGQKPRGTRHAYHFRMDGERWWPIRYELGKLREGKMIQPPEAMLTQCELTYRNGKPAEFTWAIEPGGPRMTCRIERWEHIDKLDPELLADVNREGWDPRQDGLLRYEQTTVLLETGTGVGAWKVSEFKDGKFAPLREQWVTMTQAWRPERGGIEQAVKDLLEALGPDKPERVFLCETGPKWAKNEDLQAFLKGVHEALEQREILYETGSQRAMEMQRRLHRLTPSVRVCYDGTLLKWILFAPGARRGTAWADYWIPHPGWIPEGGEVTPKGPPGHLQASTRRVVPAEPSLDEGLDSKKKKTDRVPRLKRPK